MEEDHIHNVVLLIRRTALGEYIKSVKDNNEIEQKQLEDMMFDKFPQFAETYPIVFLKSCDLKFPLDKLSMMLEQLKRAKNKELEPDQTSATVKGKLQEEYLGFVYDLEKKRLEKEAAASSSSGGGTSHKPEVN